MAVFSSFHELCIGAASVVRLSVCPSVCKLCAQVAFSRRQMAGSRPNLHTMVPRRVYIQDVLKFKVEMKGRVIPAHLEFHKKSLTPSFLNSSFPFFRIPIPKWLLVCAVNDAIAHMVKQFVRLITIL